MQGACGNLVFALTLLVIVVPQPSHAKPKPQGIEDNILDSVNDDLQKKNGQGRYAIELADSGGKSLEQNRYTHGIPGRWAVSEFPHVFTIEGKPLFSAGPRLEAEVPVAGGVRIYCKSVGNDDDQDALTYLSRCTADIPPGKYTIEPFGLEFEIGTAIATRHSALQADGNKLAIRTAAVTFQSVDADGRAAMLTGFRLVHVRTNLLEHLVDTAAEPAFSSLTLFLPIGTEYGSSLGRFAIDDAGRVSASQLAPGVELRENTLTQKVTAAFAPPLGEIARGYWPLSHNLRRVFKRGEAARFDVIVAGPEPAAQVRLVVQSGQAPPREIGKLRMPAVEAATDARLMLFDTSALPPGKYAMSVAQPDAHPFEFEIVEILPTTPLFLFTVNSCGESPFTFDSAGLDELREAHLQCWSSYGHGSVLGKLELTAAPLESKAPPNAPQELRRAYTPQRALLDDTLRHGLGMIDYENRRLGWYNEGLAFHHSHRMSVERMVRRVQIFGQELEDYPAFAGLSYTWFPSLGGYVEGGVCSDPFFGTRMEVLRQKVKQETGFEPLTADESRQLSAVGGGGGDKRALAEKLRNYWRAEQRLGWGQTLALYDQKLHDVRSDFIATMSENAGHDSGKSLRDMAQAHDAMAFESYTDFGDWPMSAGFVADWGHGQAPGKPMWQGVESSQSEPAICAKQFYKFARGAEGIAVGINPPTGKYANQKRGRTNLFLERYGPLVTEWSADTQVAICVSEVQFAEYDAHALHSHLARLGYGPIIVSERTLESGGVPVGIKALFIPNLKIPFSSKAEAALRSFQSRGGRVVLVGEHCEPIEGALRIDTPLKTLFDVGGFAAHRAFFAEFRKVRPGLEKALAEMALVPRNGAEPEKAVILPSISAGVRYAAVIASSLDEPDTQFAPATDVTVRVGESKVIINLVTGETLTLKDGAVHLDLVTEPAAFLALLDRTPQQIHLHFPPQVESGQTLELHADLDLPGDARGPLEYTLTDAGGNTRATFYRLSGGHGAVTYSVPALEAPGVWKVTATDLLGGVTASAPVSVVASHSSSVIVAEAPDVYLPHPDRLTAFLSHQVPVRIVVEQSQRASHLADAERLVAALRKIGRDATVQNVSSSSFDMYWLRWLPRPQDEQTLARIDAGEVVGYRGDLKPYINTAKRAMSPEKGGWADLAPSYVLRTDVIVFSGGQIADSLGVLTDWMATRSIPGKGRGVIEVCLSPFWANRDAVAVVSNDDNGRRAAIDRLVELIEDRARSVAAPPFKPAVRVAPLSVVNGEGHVKLPTPLKAFVPPALVESLSASLDGWAIVQMKNAAAVVSPAGDVRGLTHFDVAPRMAHGGIVFGANQHVIRRHPSWNFPMSWSMRVERLGPDGHLQQFDVPEAYAPGDQFDGWDRDLLPSPDGTTYFAGRDGGGFFLIDPGTNIFRAEDAATRQLRYYEQVRVPVSVTAAAFSSDGACVGYSVGTHPTGYGGMMGPPPSPYATALRLIDAKSAKTIWQAQSKRFNDSSLSAVAGCIAVSDRGRRTALIDWEQEAAVFDEHGKELFRKPIFDWRARYAWNTNPKPLRCELSRDGATALFASDGVLLLTNDHGSVLASINVPALVDARLAADGSAFFTGDQPGRVTAYDRGGHERWRLQTEGERPKLAPTTAGLFVGDGAGELLLVDSGGAVVRKVSVAATRPGESHAERMALTGPALYREPPTLELLKGWGAKQLIAWEPGAGGAKFFGREFHDPAGGIKLSVDGSGKRLVHLVYRIGPKPVQLILAGGDHPITFTLDLPTPVYRVVDLPYTAKQGMTVSLAPADGLSVAEISVHAFSLPGSNALYVRPADSASHVEGLETKKRPTAPGEDPDLVLDDKDPASAAKAAQGKMKNAAIFANNSDPDQVEGHYIRATGNPLDNFDGLCFTDGNPSAWTKGEQGPFGSRLLVDLNHMAHPILCATYARTLKQSELMSGIAILKGEREDFALGENAGPDRLIHEPRVIGGVVENDQFFNVFDVRGVDVAALGVYLISREGKDLGLSEVELYE